MAAWQGPALLCYNNSTFTPADFHNISRIGQGSKQERPAATGVRPCIARTVPKLCSPAVGARSLSLHGGNCKGMHTAECIPALHVYENGSHQCPS